MGIQRILSHTTCMEGLNITHFRAENVARSDCCSVQMHSIEVDSCDEGGSSFGSAEAPLEAAQALDDACVETIGTRSSQEVCPSLPLYPVRHSKLENLFAASCSSVEDLVFSLIHCSFQREEMHCKKGTPN
jgi:hypothetical protein